MAIRLYHAVKLPASAGRAFTPYFEIDLLSARLYWSCSVVTGL